MPMLGRYRIDGRIGEGAMAEVFRAHDPGIDRIVAIKALKEAYRRHPEIAQRFLREATAAGTLSHANIATIYDVGEADGVAYMAMELVNGRPLDDALKTHGRMPYQRVLALGIQMADALAYAHAHGIVHRDVKPSNIMLTDDGATTKLLDFGVARIGTADAGSAEMARTQIGQLVGTPRYMSPEQALGVPADHRSDLFSLGAVLYEMVTGKVAFDGSGLATLTLQITQEQPEPVERSAADCPKGLRFIIGKLLAKRPEQRFADGRQLAQALQRELETARAGEERSRRRGMALRLKLPLILCGATAVALGGSVWTVLDRQKDVLEHMAVVSGSSITAFVTANAALPAVENAGLPAAQQDWAPLQAFVDTAARDGGVGRLVVADASGTVRAASDRGLVGRRFASASNEVRVGGDGDAVVTAAPNGAGLRFVRPIRYAGAKVGTVDLLLRRTALDAAVGGSRDLLVSLSLFIMAVVGIVAWLSGSYVLHPLRRLRRALEDVADGDFAFRLSHRRRDEFGATFDAFNRATAAVEDRVTAVESVLPLSMGATVILQRAA